MLHRTRTLVVSILISLLTACGGGGGDGGTPAPVPNADPTGYYDTRGTASVLAGAGNTQVAITDLQGIIHNNRLMMLSAATDLSYDGSITVSGNSYSGTLSVYFEGTHQGTASVTGTISQGSSVSGTLTGTGAGSGSFQLLYAASNSETAALGRVENLTNWEGPIGGSTSGYQFAVDSAGTISHDIRVTNGVFQACDMYGSLTAISDTNLYLTHVTFDVTSCSNAAVYTVNDYTGLATTVSRGGTDNILVMIATNGSYSIASEFIR